VSGRFRLPPLDRALVERMRSVLVDISMIRPPFDTPSAAIDARAKERGLRVVG
jgi:hypothetical protein